MTLPTSALVSDGGAVDYTNPAHAATLAVMMQHAQISSSSVTSTTSSCSATADAASCSTPTNRRAPASSASAPPCAAAPAEPQDVPRKRHSTHCIVRRSSALSASCPAARQQPRRSSLRTSSSFCEGDGSSPPPPGERRQQRRRSSVTFNDDNNETKEVPKLECPVQRDTMFYKAEDYTQFRREHIREKRAEVRERAAMMMRWKTTFGSGPTKKTSSSGGGADRDLNVDSSPSKMTFGRIKSTTTVKTTTAQFAQNFRRSVSQSHSTTYKLPASVKPAVRTARLA